MILNFDMLCPSMQDRISYVVCGTKIVALEGQYVRNAHS